MKPMTVARKTLGAHVNWVMWICGGCHVKSRHRLFVAIAYGKGVIMCEQFPPDLRFDGVNYRQFVLEHFPLALEKSTNPVQKLVLQDGDPVQKSRQAHLAYDAVRCSIFDIPARSPDSNPIENPCSIMFEGSCQSRHEKDGSKRRPMKNSLRE